MPLPVADEAVRLAVIAKLGWIRRQRARFEDQPRQSKREMVSGESHYFLGQRRWPLRDVARASEAVKKSKYLLTSFYTNGRVKRV